jgi:hypothetical protein
MALERSWGSLCPVANEEDEAFEDLSQAFDEYKQVLRATEYPLSSFRTPMQRAVSVAKLMASNHLARMEESEVSRLSNLLPPGLTTVQQVDLARLIVKTKTQRWRLTVPTTLVSMSGGGGALLNSQQSGGVEVLKLENEEKALTAFEQSFKSCENRGNYPLFVHKKDQKQTTFHMNLTALRELWALHRNSCQSVQHYILPPGSSLSLVRAHWKRVKKRTIYYRITLKPQKRPIKRQESLPSLTKYLNELRKLPSLDNSRQFAVSGKASSQCWVLKTTKPISAVDNMLANVRKLLEATLLQPGQTVKEVVCDFVQDQEGKWVLLECKGLCYEAAGKVVSQIVEWKPKIDIKFILFPLFDKKEQLEKRIRAANHMEDTSLNSCERRISILGMNELKRQQEEAKKHPLTPVRRVSFLYTPPPDPNPAFTQVVKRYDDMVKSIKLHKLELTGITNYCDKYGRQFWRRPLASLQLLLTGEVGSRYFYHQMSMEEGGMMRRCFERVLEGNCGLHFKQALRRIHANKGIHSREFIQFLRGMEQILLAADVPVQECNLILRRFRGMEQAICHNISRAH